MGKEQTFAGLDKLVGKKVLLKLKNRYDSVHLESMVKAQQGTIVKDLDKTADYLVLSDLSAGVTVQKQVLALNAKGASIQVIDQAAFTAMVTPGPEEMVALLRAGGAKAADIFNKLAGRQRYYSSNRSLAYQLAAENFDGAQLTGFEFVEVGFTQCSFAGAALAGAMLPMAKQCNFEKAELSKAHLWIAVGCRFGGANMTEAHLMGDITGADFSAANLEKSWFQARGAYSARSGTSMFKLADVVFRKARLAGANFEGMALAQPVFEYADVSNAVFTIAEMEEANFRGATAVNATFASAKLKGADFSGADLHGANFGDADLSGAKMDGADVAGCNFRGATLMGVDFSKARNYEPNAAAVGTVGTALKELDTLVAQAKKIDITVNVGTEGDGEPMSVNSAMLKYGWGVSPPRSLATRRHHTNRGQSLSDALLQAANLIGNRKIRFETLDVSSTKSPKGGKELRDLVMKGLEEAFAQSRPGEDELEKLTKAYRDKDKEKNAAAKEEREKERAEAEKAREKEKKQAEKKIEKAVGGKVKDIGTFLTALELRIEEAKIKKATSMLKKSGFQLYNDVTETFMSGVVKSQTDADLVYACRINADGTYACCTQNLNICGGLRGSICKHLLVLIIGLVQAEKLDPTVINGWVAKSMHQKAALDKEKMGEIFIKYKGAEAGEVDWRPTETLPEDYYAV